MDPYQTLKDHISQRVAMPEAELEHFARSFSLKKVKKRQYIIQPDFVPQHRSYVVKGALRSYVLDQNGVDTTIQFAIEDWWISDYNGYIYQQPATMFVMALEDCTLLQLDFETEQQLKKANHLYETFFRIGGERTAAFHQRRIITSLTQTAEERYHTFMATYPHVAQRIPQYALASYLGMTTQFLSRIRKSSPK